MGDQHRIQLDTELNLTDKGISAYLGANVETGALGVFLAAVRDGTIPKGSWPIVESLGLRVPPLPALSANDDVD